MGKASSNRSESSAKHVSLTALHAYCEPSARKTGRFFLEVESKRERKMSPKERITPFSANRSSTQWRRIPKRVSTRFIFLASLNPTFDNVNKVQLFASVDGIDHVAGGQDAKSFVWVLDPSPKSPGSLRGQAFADPCDKTGHRSAPGEHPEISSEW